LLWWPYIVRSSVLALANFGLSPARSYTAQGNKKTVHIMCSTTRPFIAVLTLQYTMVWHLTGCNKDVQQSTLVVQERINLVSWLHLIKCQILPLMVISMHLKLTDGFPVLLCHLHLATRWGPGALLNQGLGEGEEQIRKKSKKPNSPFYKE